MTLWPCSLKEDTGVLASLQGVDKINENMRQQIEDSEDFRQVLRKKAKNHYRSAGLQCLIAGNFEEWSIAMLGIVVHIKRTQKKMIRHRHHCNTCKDAGRQGDGEILHRCGCEADR